MRREAMHGLARPPNVVKLDRGAEAARAEHVLLARAPLRRIDHTAGFHLAYRVSRGQPAVANCQDAIVARR